MDGEEIKQFSKNPVEKDLSSLEDTFDSDIEDLGLDD
jgi:hypothetical protein